MARRTQGRIVPQRQAALSAPPTVAPGETQGSDAELMPTGRAFRKIFHTPLFVLNVGLEFSRTLEAQARGDGAHRLLENRRPLFIEFDQLLVVGRAGKGQRVSG